MCVLIHLCFLLPTFETKTNFENIGQQSSNIDAGEVVVISCLIAIIAVYIMRILCVYIYIYIHTCVCVCVCFSYVLVHPLSFF